MNLQNIHGLQAEFDRESKIRFLELLATIGSLIGTILMPALQTVVSDVSARNFLISNDAFILAVFIFSSVLLYIVITQKIETKFYGILFYFSSILLSATFSGILVILTSLGVALIQNYIFILEILYTVFTCMVFMFLIAPSKKMSAGGGI